MFVPADKATLGDYYQGDVGDRNSRASSDYLADYYSAMSTAGMYDQDNLGFSLKLPKLSISGIKSSLKGAANLAKKALPVASFIPGLNVVAAPLAIAQRAGAVAKAVAKKKPAAPAPVVRAAVSTAKKPTLPPPPATRMRPSQLAPVKAPTAAVVRAAGSTATKSKQPFIPPPSTSTKTVAEKAGAGAKVAKKVVDAGAFVRRLATSASEKVKAEGQKVGQLAAKAQALAAAGDSVGATKFAAQARAVAENVQNAQAQLEQTVAPALSAAGSVAEGAATGAVAGAGLSAIPKPILYGVPLLAAVGVYLLTKKK